VVWGAGLVVGRVSVGVSVGAGGQGRGEKGGGCGGDLLFISGRGKADRVEGEIVEGLLWGKEER
jgi:hypothetical protein